jgi:membrane fusion protein (multidrug efflux system)
MGCNEKEAAPEWSDAGPPESGSAGRTGATPPLAAATRDETAAALLTLSTHLFVDRDVAVYTRRAGIVEKVLAARGERVRQGQILCELESKDLRLALELATLEAERAGAEYQRARELHEQSTISDEEYEEADFRRRSTEREVEMAAHELEKTYVRAPFDGIVSGREVETGQVLFEEDTRPLFRVTAFGPLLARLYLPQWSFAYLSTGAAVTLSPRVAILEPVPGRILWVNHVLDAASGSTEVVVKVDPGASGDIRPGMEVDVEILLSLPAGRITLPGNAVKIPASSASHGEVLLRRAGRSVPTMVRLGFLGDDRVAILSGLTEGDQVVILEKEAP